MNRAKLQGAILYTVVASIGFSCGAWYFSRPGTTPAEPGGGRESLAAWAARQPGAAAATGSGTPPARDGFERAQRVKHGGIGSAVRDHLQLVRETPLAELPELLLRYEGSMPGPAGVGELARAAIVDRLLAEDPDALLDFALTGRSGFLEANPQRWLLPLREQLGYEALRAKFAAGGIPAVTMQLMGTLLSQEIADDPGRGWQLALENGRVDLQALAAQNFGAEAVASLLLGERHEHLPESTIRRCFGNHALEDAAAAIRQFEQLDSPRERLAAIGGLGAVLALQPPGTLASFAAALASDQERLALYRAAISDSKFWDGASSLFPSPPHVNVIEMGTQLGVVLEIENGYVRRTLLEENLTKWKVYLPEQARAWAEEHGYQELWERLPSGFPVDPTNPGGFDIADPFADFDPPEIPSQFQPFPPTDEDEG